MLNIIKKIYVMCQQWIGAVLFGMCVSEMTANLIYFCKIENVFSFNVLKKY